MKLPITAERLRELLHYDPATGVFTRNVSSRGRRSYAGAVCGCPDRKGHIYIFVDGKRYAAHRLAWLYEVGVWPADQIDHINGEKADNRFENLREADSFINAQNRTKSWNQLGILGVSKVKNRYRALISKNGKSINLGLFSTPEEAHQRYLTEKRLLHPGCTI